MCRHCGVLIGFGYKEGHAQCMFDSRVGDDPCYKKIVVKIRALQPSDVENGNGIENGNGNENGNGSTH